MAARSRDELFCMLDDGRSALLLGYELELTKSEYIILSAIAHTEEPLSRERILELCFKGRSLKPVNVGVHVYNINKKASDISGRKLVVGDRRHGYRIVDDI